MAKVKYNSINFTKALNKKLKEFTRNGKELQKAANTIVREIRADSVDGIGYDGKSFPSIKTATKNRRSILANYNKTSRFFSVNKSNITFSGDTVKKIKGVTKGRKMVIGGRGNHELIKGVRGKALSGSNASISDILKGLSDLGYKILGVSERAQRKINVQFRRWLRRNIK